MSANSYGLSGLVFGTPSLTGYVVQSHSTSSKPNVFVEVQDENGKVVHRRADDITTEVTFDAVFAGASLPTAGATFTVDGVTYIAMSIDLKRTNKGFKEVSIKGKTSEGVSLP